MAVKRFEELIAWQRARELTREVYATTRTADFSRDYGLCNQIQRASVSVMSNIAEGFDRATRPQFRQFLVTAKASCAEVRSILYVALDIGYLKAQAWEKLIAKAEEVSRITTGPLNSLGRN